MFSLKSQPRNGAWDGITCREKVFSSPSIADILTTSRIGLDQEHASGSPLSLRRGAC